MAGGCHPLCGHHPKSHAHRPCRCGRVPSAVPAILAVQPPSSSSSPSPVIFRAVVATAMAVLHVVVLVARLSVLSCPPPRAATAVCPDSVIAAAILVPPSMSLNRNSVPRQVLVFYPPIPIRCFLPLLSSLGIGALPRLPWMHAQQVRLRPYLFS